MAFRLPTASDLGPDPEPLGERFDVLLARSEARRLTAVAGPVPERIDASEQVYVLPLRSDEQGDRIALLSA